MSLPMHVKPDITGLRLRRWYDERNLTLLSNLKLYLKVEHNSLNSLMYANITIIDASVYM